MGQSKKLRSCPAVGREIAPAECGENRLSRYACPEGCPFNPFAAANYTALLAGEDRLDGAIFKRLIAEDPAAGDRILAAQRANPDHGLHAATAWRLFFKQDSGGLAFARRWEAAGFSGLANDERVFFRGKMQLRIVLLEVRRIFDGERFEAVDLLDAGGPPLVFIDRSLAGGTVRFSTFLTWAYPLPHFWRTSGTGIVMSDLGPFPPLEMLEACLAHLGGPAERGAQRRWLAENFTRLDEALVATGLERRRQMFAAMDGSWTVATYALCAPAAEALAALVKETGVDDEQPTAGEREQGFQRAMVWLEHRPPQGGVPAGSQTVLGRVLLGEKEWRIEAMGEARFGRLRAAFEARMGAQVKFSRQRRDNIAGKLAAGDPPANLALVPPGLLANPLIFDLSSSRVPSPPPGQSIADYEAAMFAEHRRAWIDGALPAFEGRTPRAAARDPAMRVRLVELVKAQVRQADQRNLETGRADDINAFIRELGLAEIDLPPPPARPRPAAPEAPDDLDGDFAPAAPRAGAGRPAAPRLIGPPLNEAQASSAIRGVLAAFELAADGLDELAVSGATVIDDIAELTDGMLTDEEFNFLVTFLMQAWFALVPGGVRAPALDYEEMARGFNRPAERFAESGDEAAEAFVALTRNCRQPALLDALALGLFDGIARVSGAMRPSQAAIPVMLLTLCALIDELDRALRRG